MERLRDRIPRDKFEEIFRPVVRELGTRNVVLRLNNIARTAIPRQTKLNAFMPKLETLIYERQRPKADEEIERLWNIYFETRLGEKQEEFGELSSKLNELLDQDKLPEDEQKRQEVARALDAIEQMLTDNEFSQVEVEAVFRIKAFKEVLDFYLERKSSE